MNPISQADLHQNLRDAGLRPTVGRMTVLRLMLDTDQPQCCEDLYRRAMQTGRSLNVSSIAHALADLERAGRLERMPLGEERRQYYRRPLQLAPMPELQLYALIDGHRHPIHDTVLAQRLVRWLTEHHALQPKEHVVIVSVESRP